MAAADDLVTALTRLDTSLQHLPINLIGEVIAVGGGAPGSTNIGKIITVGAGPGSSGTIIGQVVQVGMGDVPSKRPEIESFRNEISEFIAETRAKTISKSRLDRFLSGVSALGEQALNGSLNGVATAATAYFLS